MTTLGHSRPSFARRPGPFWVALDIFLPTATRTHAVASISGRRIHRRALLRPPSEVKVFLLPDLQAIKVSFPASTPKAAHDRDMHARRQYVPLLDVEF
jgi:hypothetical protein